LSRSFSHKRKLIQYKILKKSGTTTINVFFPERILSQIYYEEQRKRFYISGRIYIQTDSFTDHDIIYGKEAWYIKMKKDQGNK
jgi:hypothetical protein